MIHLGSDNKQQRKNINSTKLASEMADGVVLSVWPFNTTLWRTDSDGYTEASRTITWCNAVTNMEMMVQEGYNLDS